MNNSKLWYTLSKEKKNPLWSHCIFLPKKRRDVWLQQKRCFLRTTMLIKSLDKLSITSAQATELDGIGIAYEDSNTNHQHFYTKVNLRFNESAV